MPDAFGWHQIVRANFLLVQHWGVERGSGSCLTLLCLLILVSSCPYCHEMNVNVASQQCLREPFHRR